MSLAVPADDVPLQSDLSAGIPTAGGVTAAAGDAGVRGPLAVF
jgi:hypothetical protein